VTKNLQLDFDAVYGGDDFKNKIQGLRFLGKKFKTKPPEMIYIADRLGDAKIAKRFGCHCVLLRACSFEKEKLSKMKADNIAPNLSGIQEYLNKLEK
jgi:phosphoglycolate phosphatase-like HAD superfamily hydrolase